MSDTAKSYLKYILLFAAAMVGFVIAYVLSVVMFFFFIGVITLPIVIIGFPIGIYILWSIVLKTASNRLVNYLLLIGSLILYIFAVIQLDAVSWSEKGNLSYYLEFFQGK